jgi:uncharacterized protein YggE
MDTSQVRRPSGFGDTMNNLFANKGVAYPIFILILVIVGAYIVKGFYTRPSRTITVVGIGSKKVQPTSAVVSFSVVVPGGSQQEAINAGEQKFGSILNSVASFQASVEKTAYQVVQSESGGGYQYVSAAKLTVNGPEKASEMVKALYQSGATIVAQPRFIPQDQERVDREVRELAVKDARARAGEMARASGAWVGKVISIQEGGSTGESGTSVTGTQSDQQSSILGEIEIQALATVVYELR